MAPISVLMPVFNTAPYLQEAIESILNQSFRDFELVILDDGSSDDSLEIARRLAQTDRRIRLHSRANRGLVDTRNELLTMARGSLIAWADSDDHSRPQRLALQSRRFAREPHLVCLGSAWQVIDESGLPIRPFYMPLEDPQVRAKMFHDDYAIAFNTAMMRSDAARLVGGFRHPFLIGEDYDLCIRLMEIGQGANLPEILVDYRQHLQSTVHRSPWKCQTYSALVKELARERQLTGSDRLQRGETVQLKFLPDLPPRQNAEQLFHRWAWWALQHGHLDTARKYALKVLRLSPRRKESWILALCAARGY